VVLSLSSPALGGTQFSGIGRAATPAEVRAWDIDVRPDFKGLPAGSGSVAAGQRVWDAKCASCHGTFGESNEVFAPLVGGTTAADIRSGRVQALSQPDIARTSLMKLSSLATLWDYVNRAMPWDAPRSLKVDEVYAVVAYMLHLGDILPADFVLADGNMAEVQELLPNRNGMTRRHGLWDIRGAPDVRNAPCMRDCATQVTLASVFPEGARGSHGDLSQQNRIVGPVRADAIASPPSDAAAALARRNGCLGCHSVEKRVVGPAFREVSAKYRAEPDAENRLVARLKQGSSGIWGPLAMPPYPGLAEADALALVRWVLSR
jgi:cytochrome c